MTVAFICVNYNNVNYTKQFIESIRKISTDIKIVIVDNDSNENDIVELKKIHDENVEVIFSDKNVGYFRGLNLGINAIDAKNYDFVVIGNNDLYFESNFVEELKKMQVNNDILCIAPNIIRLDGIHQNPHIINKFGFKENLYRKLYYSNYYVSIVLQKFYNSLKFMINPTNRVGNEKEMIITMGYGACYILNKNFFNHFKELDAPNFLMEEEGVLANQVLSVGGKTLYFPNLIVNHHDHTSIGKIPSKKLYNFAKESYKHYKHLTYLH